MARSITAFKQRFPNAAGMETAHPTADERRTEPREGSRPLVRGALRYALHLSVLGNFLLAIGLVWSNQLWFRANRDLTARLHGGLVFEVGPEGTRAVPAAEFQNGPKPVEIASKAFEIVALILGADSTEENYVYRNFAKARAGMTEKLAEEFDRTIAPTAKDIKDSQTMRLVQSQPGEIRPATAEELPSGYSLAMPGYHMVVLGKQSTFSKEDNKPLYAGRLAYYVQLVPDQQGRTVANTTGLKWAAMVPIQVPDPIEKSKEKAHARPSSDFFKSPERRPAPEPATPRP